MSVGKCIVYYLLALGYSGIQGVDAALPLCTNARVNETPSTRLVRH